jgi:mannose PTS system EIIA component
LFAEIWTHAAIPLCAALLSDAFCVSTPNKTIVLVAEAPFDIAQDRVPMIGLVLVTHGRLADEFRAALEHVMGPQKQIEAITIGAEDAADLCRSDIIEAVNRVDSGDGVAILTDMFGGTPSNLAISCMSRPNVEVLAGINLPMLVKLAKVRGNRSLPEAVDMAQEAGRKYVTVASSVLAGK